MRKLNSSKKISMTLALSLLLPLTGMAVVFADGLRVQSSLNPVVHPPEVLQTAMTTGIRQDVTDGLDRTLSAHEVQLDSANRLSGVISGIDKSGNSVGVSGLSVTLVQRSEEQARTVTGFDGSFQTPPLVAGSYTLCVAGADGFLAYGIEIVDSNIDSESNDLPTPSPEDAAAIDRGRQHQFAAVTRIAQGEEPVEITAAVIPPQFTALQEIMANVPASAGMTPGSSGGKTQINVRESVIAGGFEVTLQDDGRLVGRITPLKSEADKPIRMRERMNVYLIQDDEIVNETLAQLNGEFVFTNVEPDVYGFAAAGSEGFAALSFHAVSAEDLESSSRDTPYQRVSHVATRRNADSLQVAISPPEDLPYLRDVIDSLNEDERLAALPFPGGPMPGGPMPGGGFGGPGGGGFGADWGGLIELGLAAWVLSELIDDGNNEVINPVPTSPF